jgi:hypothetical protein
MSSKSDARGSIYETSARDIRDPNFVRRSHEFSWLIVRSLRIGPEYFILQNLYIMIYDMSQNIFLYSTKRISKRNRKEIYYWIIMKASHFKIRFKIFQVDLKSNKISMILVEHSLPYRFSISRKLVLFPSWGELRRHLHCSSIRKS